jgi:hypothetical protein
MHRLCSITGCRHQVAAYTFKNLSQTDQEKPHLLSIGGASRAAEHHTVE